jgi:hypothetical protein
MNKINNIDKISLQYLINPNIIERHTKKDEKELNLEFKEDKEFYRKRIFKLFKDMLNDKFENEILKDYYEEYISSLISYLKEVDTKDLLQEHYMDLSFNKINNKKLENKTLSENNSIIYNKQKIIEKQIKMDKFVINTQKENKEYLLPKTKDINLKDPKLRRKGIEKKENI